MKTQQEIEKMQDALGILIQESSEKMNGPNDFREMQILSDRNRQRMAQYDILLEVLK